MKIFVLGGGGREHAICWALSRSSAVSSIHCAPGNAGIENSATVHPLDISDPIMILDLTRSLSPDLVVIGPEAPLMAGVADILREHGFPVLGPGKAGAMLEGSKAFAKLFMARHGIPTAHFDICESLDQAEKALLKRRPPYVVKADGLAAGKGAFVLGSFMEARDTCAGLMVKMILGESGKKVVIEDHLPGEELTVLVVTDGSSFRILPSSQDHKRAFDGDKGPNTGGMGAYSPVPWADNSFMEKVTAKVIEPTVSGLKKDSIPFRGILYFGLMVDPAGEAKVLEYNVRMGDPETQVVLPAFAGDFALLAEACARESLGDIPQQGPTRTAVGVVLASGGYPGPYEKGYPLSGLPEVEGEEGTFIFHSGTARDNTGRVITSGGRVLTVVGTGEGIPEARSRAYKVIKKIGFEGARFRSDIALKGGGRPWQNRLQE